MASRSSSHHGNGLEPENGRISDVPGYSDGTEPDTSSDPGSTRRAEGSNPPRKPRGQRKPSSKGVNVLPAFEQLIDVVEAGLYPYGCEDDPAWEADHDAMEFLTSRKVDDYRTRQIPKITLEAVDGGWKAVVADLTWGYACTFQFRNLDDLFESFCEARKRASCWKEIGYGEGAQKRKAMRKKKFDDATKGVVD